MSIKPIKIRPINILKKPQPFNGLYNKIHYIGIFFFLYYMENLLTIKNEGNFFIGTISITLQINVIIIKKLLVAQSGAQGVNILIFQCWGSSRFLLIHRINSCNKPTRKKKNKKKIQTSQLSIGRNVYRQSGLDGLNSEPNTHPIELFKAYVTCNWIKQFKRIDQINHYSYVQISMIHLFNY